MESERHYPLVLVTWHDATTFYGWHSIEKAKALEAKEIQTTGFLVQEGRDYLVVAASLGECEEHDGADAGDPFVIPMSWVTRVEKLGLAAGCTCEKEEAKPLPTIVGKIVGGYTRPPLILEEDKETLAAWQAGVGQRPTPVEDCWGAPALEPLEVKPGDDRLDRPFTLDEHLRRARAAE